MRILVDISRQTLNLHAEDGALLREYPVSTAALGVGEQKGSFQTPRGRHVIRAKIGAGLPSGAVLKARRPTGEICTPELVAYAPERDWILSRILWLSGCQPGFNRLGNCDTMARYIYIHGTPDSEPMGAPKSHGCIRMRNGDVIDLFERVALGTEVLIRAGDADSPASFPLSILDWRRGWCAIRPLREAVFVREHGIPAELEFDEKDQLATHLVLWNGEGEAVACARLLREGYLGRIGVLPAWRGQGLGKRLVAAALEEARRIGWKELRLTAMANKTAFYLPFGFEPVGDEFEAAGLPHQAMRCFL
ncbi:GNAT family N-acetyltransferase [Formivibrio citricus]|nr:GNAT family N-acetyltransferase [Formivibrio citricus]